MLQLAKLQLENVKMSVAGFFTPGWIAKCKCPFLGSLTTECMNVRNTVTCYSLPS